MVKPSKKKQPTKRKQAKKSKAKKPQTKKARTKKKPTPAKKRPATKKKPAPAKKQKPAAKKKPVAKTRPRRDATGHLDLAYEKDLLRRSRENDEHDDDRAFLVGKRAEDALADELGAEFVETVTSGEDEGVELRDKDVPEEEGGPFVPSTVGKEIAEGPDASNPRGATREPFPKT